MSEPIDRLATFKAEMEQIRCLLGRPDGPGFESTTHPNLTLIVGGASERVNSAKGRDDAA